MNQTCKRLLSFVLVVMMVVSMMPTTVFATEAVTADLTISTSAELKAFADDVNAGNSYEGKLVVLANDIDLEYTAVVIGTKANPFKGTFDGQEHTVANLTIYEDGSDSDYFADSDDCLGLFGVINTPATVKNVTVSNPYIVGSGYVGGIVGMAYTGKIENCHVTGEIDIEGFYMVGGITGHGYARITDCSVIGAEGWDYSFVGATYKEANLEGDNVGGIVGHSAENNVISGCTVKNITVSGTRKVAGIVGITAQSTDITNCTVENVTVETVATEEYAADNAKTMSIGGIVGQYMADGNGVGGTLTDCTVNGLTFANENGVTVNAGALTGGVRGTTNGTVAPAEDSIAASGNTVATVNGATVDFMEPAAPSYAAQIGEDTYTTLEEAFAAAAEGETIVLLADATPALTSQRAITKAAVIDLNGNTLTLTEDDLYFGTTTFENGNIVVDPSVKPSTAVFWMFANQTLTFNAVKLTATDVTGTYLIGLDGNNSDLNLVNGSQIIIDNATALDLDVICVNASTGNDILIENSKVTVNNLDGRVFFRGNYTVSGASDIDLSGITKAGFRIEAGQTLTIADTATVDIAGEPRDGGIHLTDTTSVYNKAETATVNAVVNAPVVAPAGTITYGYTSNTAIWGEATANAKESFRVEVYVGDEKIGSATLNNIGGIIDGDVFVTWNVPFAGSNDEYWTVQWEAGHPNTAEQPTKVVLFVDGEKVAENDVKMNAPDDLKPVVWEEIPGLIKVVTGLKGAGTEADPYKISCIEELLWFQAKVDEQAADGSTQFTGKYFQLTADIDLAGVNWNPIGSMSGDHGSFKGVFDGNGHTISNLNCQQAGNGLGLFARTAGNAVIKNLTLENVKVNSTNNANYVGGVVGNAYASTKIENVHVTGAIDISGRGYIGGIAGHGYVVMDNVSVIGEGTISSTFWCAGGILGYAGEGSTNIMNAKVEGTGETYLTVTSAAGGLGAIVGMAEDNNGTQPISGYNLSAKNVNVKTYTGAYGDAYANYALGYLYGGNPTSILTGELNVENVTIETSSGEEPEVQDAVASVDGKIYFNLQTAVNAANGKNVVLLRDVELTEALNVTNTVTLDLNGKTITGKPVEAKAFSVIANKGNLTITGAGCVICDHQLTGSTAYAVNTITNSGTLTIDGATIENKSTASNQIGYAIDNNSTTGNAIVVISGGEVKASGSNYYDGIRQFCNSQTNENAVTVAGGTVSSLWMQNPSDGATDKDTKDVKGSVSITGGTVKALYLEPSSAFEAEISDGYVGSVSYFTTSEGRDLTGFISGGTFGAPVAAEFCADGYTPVDNGDGTYGVKVQLPEVEITDIKDTLTDSDPDLTFALNFAIKDVENLTDDYLNALFNTYGDYYVDYVLTIDGLNGDTVTFNADGSADGYLAGQYDAWSSSWVCVPFDDVVVEDGQSLYIMEYAAKLMNKQGLRFTLAEVAEIVQNFDCGVYFTPEFQAAHPDMKVTLQLKVFTEDAEGNKIQNIDVATNVFEVEPVQLPEVVVTDIKDTLTDSDPDLTFALNFAIKDVENLTDDYLNALFDAYGDYYVDYVLTINGLNGDTVTFNAGGNADGYLAGQYDAWSSSWVCVPFDDVVVEDGQSLYIMEYAAKLMNKQGLRFTLAEVAEIVQNFDCGVYFTPEFLAEHPDLDVSLQLKVFTEDAEGNKIQNIDVATNEFKNDYVAIVTAEGRQTQYFTSFDAAYTAAQAGETVELLKDVKLTGKLTMNKAITIDGNGCSIIADETVVWYTTGPKPLYMKQYKTHLLGVNASNITLKDVVLDCNNNAAGINVYCAQDVVFDNVQIINATKGMAALTVNGSTLTVKNGLTALGNSTALDISNGTGVTSNLGVTIEDGAVLDLGGKVVKFASVANNDMTGAVDANGDPYFVAMDNAYYYTQAQMDSRTGAYSNGLTLLENVTINKDLTVGSTLNLNGYDLTVADGKALKVTGKLTIAGEGNFDGDVKLTKETATLTAPEGMDVASSVDGYKVVYENGTYKLVKFNYVAEVNGVKYETLAEAVAAAGANDIITLYADIDADEIVIIKKPVTIKANGFEITEDNVACMKYENAEGEKVQLTCTEVAGDLIIQPAQATSEELGNAVAYIDGDDDKAVSAGEELTTLQAALDAAAAGQTVRLTADPQVNGTIIIPADVTLDIQANTVTIKTLIGLNGSKLRGDVFHKTNAYGQLNVDPANLVLAAEGVASGTPKEPGNYVRNIPVLNGDHFVFSSMQVDTNRDKENNGFEGRGLEINEADKTLRFQFNLNLSTRVKEDLLSNGADDNALKVIVRLEWTDAEKGTAYQDFVFKNEFISKVFTEDNLDLYLEMQGYDVLNITPENVTVKGMVITDCGLEVSGFSW